MPIQSKGQSCGNQFWTRVHIQGRVQVGDERRVPVLADTSTGGKSILGQKEADNVSNFWQVHEVLLGKAVEMLNEMLNEISRG